MTGRRRPKPQVSRQLSATRAATSSPVRTSYRADDCLLKIFPYRRRIQSFLDYSALTPIIFCSRAARSKCRRQRRWSRRSAAISRALARESLRKLIFALFLSASLDATPFRCIGSQRPRHCAGSAPPRCASPARRLRARFRSDFADLMPPPTSGAEQIIRP